MKKKTNMLQSFYKWKNVRQFNKQILKRESDLKYILIIQNTIKFQLLDDLNRIFKRKYDIMYYIKHFKKLKCFTLYLTLFTLKEKQKLGPIADDISFKIVLNKLQKLLKPGVVMIGPPCLKQKYNVLSYNTFLEHCKE